MYAEDFSLSKASRDAVEEAEKAATKFGPFNSSHEGYAVILEELDELWDEIKNDKAEGSLDRQIAEAIQVAAMALRFVSETRTRKITGIRQTSYQRIN